MPIQVSYPGVYVSAITSPQPPTGGASTSIAAFVGRAPIGPINQATLVSNYAECVSAFGGLNKDSAISYQANAFFSNGGQQAVVVRLYANPTSTNITIGGLPVTTDTYTVNYEIDGVSQTAVTATGTSVATVISGLVSAFSALSALVTAKASTTDPSQLVLTAVTGSAHAVTFFVSVSSTSPPPGGTISIDEPSTLSTGADCGYAEIPILDMSKYAGTVTVAGTIAVGDVFTLIFSPPGSPATMVSYTVPSSLTSPQPSDVAAGLAQAITYNPLASRFVKAPPPATGSAVVALTYTTAAVVTTEVTSSAGTLSLPTTPAALFTLQAASPGVWGDELIASVSPAPTAGQFNLTVSYFDGTTYQVETFLGVTLTGTANTKNRLDVVLANGSRYVTWIYDASATAPTGLSIGSASGGADSAPLQVLDYLGDAGKLTGLYALNQLPYGFNILCVPPDDFADEDGQGGDQDAAVYQTAAQICVDNNAMVILDPPTTWYALWQSGQIASISIDDPLLGSYTADQARCAAIYFPRVQIADPLMNGQPRIVPPCGFIAAAWASTDTASGVWKAPAGLDVPIGGILGLQANLTDDDSGTLNPQGINALRSFNVGGDVVWGARTMRGSDVLADEYKYIPVQRLLLFIETTLLQDTQWAVFQPNGPSLWARLQTQVGTIMGNLFSQGAFTGTSASQAFFVKCDATTTTSVNQAAGVVNVQVGFAPLYPAEFVVITVSQQTASSSG